MDALRIEGGADAYRRARGFAGLYLAVHFVMLVPYAAELFSSAGMLPRETGSFFDGLVRAAFARGEAIARKAG